MISYDGVGNHDRDVTQSVFLPLPGPDPSEMVQEDPPPPFVRVKHALVTKWKQTENPPLAPVAEPASQPPRHPTPTTHTHRPSTLNLGLWASPTPNPHRPSTIRLGHHDESAVGTA